MTQKTIKDFIIGIYSNLIEENINSWLNSEEALKKSSLSLNDKIKLKENIKKISKDISGEFADELIKLNFPEKDIGKSKTEEILTTLIKKHMEKLKNENN